MKFSYLYLPLLIIWAKPLHADIDINEIKDNMYYEIVNAKKNINQLKITSALPTLITLIIIPYIQTI